MGRSTRDPLNPMPLYLLWNARTRAVEEFLTAGWPKKKERLARATMLLTLRDGGLDLADEARRHARLSKSANTITYSQAHLSERNYSETDIYRSLSCALVSWRTNRNIAAKAPAEYIPQRADESSLGEPEIRRRLASHRIDYDALIAGDYRRFLQARAEVLQPLAASLCS